LAAASVPSIRGVIKRRLLVNFRVDPEVVQRILPEDLSPKFQGDHAIAGICLIRLEQIRPALIPWSMGFSGENTAHRVAVRWRDADGADREGVYIPMRHTNSIADFERGLEPGRCTQRLEAWLAVFADTASGR
jgi:hypothetical protein